MLPEISSSAKAGWQRLRNNYVRPLVVCALVVLLLALLVTAWRSTSPYLGMRWHDAWYRALHTPQEAARQKCKRTLQNLRFSCDMYAGDYDGHLPSELGMLYEGKYCDAGAFYVVRGSGTKKPGSAAEVRAGQCDYVYLGAGLKEELRKVYATNLADPDNRTVLMYTKPGILNPWIGILFFSGRVECVKAKSMEEAAATNGWILPSGKTAGKDQ